MPPRRECAAGAAIAPAKAPDGEVTGTTNREAYQAFTALMKKSAFGEAVAFAERQCVAAGDRSEFWLTQSSLALRKAGKAKAALDAAQKACAAAPRSAWALLARAEAYCKCRNYNEARADFEAALNDERAAPLARRGLLDCLASMKAWKRVHELSLEWELPPDAKRSWLVKALIGLGRLDEAASQCEAWLSDDPENPRALWQSARIQVAREGIDAVRQRMGRLAKIPGASTVYGEIYAWLCKRSGNLEVAAQQYEKLSVGKNNPMIIKQQAYALAKSGQEPRAVPLMEEMLRLSPGDNFLNKAYIPACQRMGGLERAWTFYHELMALHPEEKGIFGRLKYVQKLLGSPKSGADGASSGFRGEDDPARDLSSGDPPL